MHELSLALNILDIVSAESQRRGGVVVRSVRVQLGPLAGVVQEALLSAYNLAREGSLSPHAELVIEAVPLVVNCPACQSERTIASVQELCCPVCGTPCGEVVRGRELEVVALEIDA